MTCIVSLWVVSGDEFLVTQSTDIRIVPRMTLHVSLYMVPGDETLATQSTVLGMLCMFLFMSFLKMNPFPHRAHCHGFGNKVSGPLVKL